MMDPALLALTFAVTARLVAVASSNTPEAIAAFLAAGIVTPSTVALGFAAGRIRTPAEVEGWKQRALTAEAAVTKLTDTSIERTTPALVQATGVLERVIGVMERVLDVLTDPPRHGKRGR